MSAGMYPIMEGDAEEENFERIAICQNRVKDIMHTLLHKRRKSVPREMDLFFDKWCLYEESLFIPPGKGASVKQNIFQLHSALDLEAKDDETDAMIAHIKELRQLLGR